MKFAVIRCKLVVITIEKSTVNNELNKQISKSKKEQVKEQLELNMDLKDIWSRIVNTAAFLN